jgi:hypothetical protein
MTDRPVIFFLKKNNVFIVEAEEVGGIAQPGWSATRRWPEHPPPANRGGPPARAGRRLKPPSAHVPQAYDCPSRERPWEFMAKGLDFGLGL